MQDLLNEEEFLQTKTYNPWKRFIMFYIITFVNSCLFVSLLQSTIIISWAGKTIVLFLAFTLLIIPFIMVFHSSKTTNLKNIKIFTAICILSVAFYLPIPFLDRMKNSLYYQTENLFLIVIKDFAYFLGYYIFCFLIIILIKRIKKKQNKA